MFPSRLRLALAVPLSSAVVPTLHGQDVEVRGQIGGGMAFGWPGVVVSIPALRVGTISGDLGRFILRGKGAPGCYELVIRPPPFARITIYRFTAPAAGPVELGEIRVQPHTTAEFVLPFGPGSPVADTLGSCTPATQTPPDSWAAARAQVVGRVTRSGAPLIGLPLDLSCGYLTPRFGQRTYTDSAGRYVFDVELVFPQDQSLSDDWQAPCQVRQAVESLDPPQQTIVSFVPIGTPVRPTTLDWELPEPTFRAARVVGQLSDLNSPPLLLGNSAGFRPGVLPFPQFVSLELRARPDRILTPQYGSIPGPPEFLPLAIRVTTGHQRPTTGSTIYLHVPIRVAGVRATGFARVGAARETAGDIYHAAFTSYDRRLHLLHITVLPQAFTQDSTGVFSATVVVGLFP